MTFANNIEEFTADNILNMADAQKVISKLRKEGKTVGLCHGGFDLVHPGHAKHFESASKLCNILFVSITSDKFVKKRKGSSRPIYPQNLRAYSIASVRFVDYVLISDFEKAVEIIQFLKPSFYIKGPDYIGKTTPGILAEKAAIEDIGGEIKFTDDPKFSSSGLINYIRNLDRKSLLLILDRDGTIIEELDYPGREPDWREKIVLKRPVIDFIHHLEHTYEVIKIVVSNQTGVAKGFFSENTVKEINKHIENLLKEQGISINDWQYCPDADKKHAESQGIDKFISSYVKEKTRRKPSTAMVTESLKKNNLIMEQFNEVLMLGDREDDKLLAENLKINFIDVKEKKVIELISTFEKLIEKK